MTRPKFLDLSGFGFSGKHAVIDLMRELRGYHVPHFAFEFLLLRIQGGILDLEDALVNDWSPVRSDAAVRRFKRLVRRVGTRNSLRRPSSLFEAVGWNYDERYAGRFVELSDAFVRRLTAASWKTDWPYPLGELNGAELFARKMLRRIGVRGALDFEVSLAAPSDFVSLARDYLEAVLTSDVPPETSTVVMHNAFEPFNPKRCLKYFHDARCIVVDRDPRDIYVQQLSYRPMAVGPRDFVARFRIFRDAAHRFDDGNRAILRIQFEDLVVDYEATLSRILDHLDESPDAHVRKREFFNPAVSRKNVGLWRQFDRPDEISYIAHELSEYCIDRDVEVSA